MLKLCKYTFGGSSIIGVCSYSYTQSKALDENSIKRLEIFKKIAEIQLQNLEYPESFPLNITNLIETEKKYQKVDTLIQNNFIFKLKKLIVEPSLIEELKKRDEILPERMPLSLKSKLLFEPCGWNGVNEIELIAHMSSDCKYPMQMLERSQHLLKNVVNISQRLLQAKLELKSHSLSPEEFKIFEEHAKKGQEGALKELEGQIENIFKLDEKLKVHMQLDHCPSNNPRKLELEKEVKEKIQYVRMLAVSMELYAMNLLIDKQDLQSENVLRNTNSLMWNEKKIYNEAELEVLLVDGIAYAAMAEGIEMRSAILSLPNRWNKELADKTGLMSCAIFDERS